MEHGKVATYNSGCGCDLCKLANKEYRKALRQRHREAAGLFGGTPVAGALRLLQGEALTSANAPVTQPCPVANMVELAVAEEIGALGDHNRPALEAMALALARVLDNPRATSTQPAAAAKLADILGKLHAASVRGRRGSLAVVRTMTERKGGA